MAKNPQDMLPKEMASAVNPFTHPVAGAAALSVLSIGLASHAFGIWMGALTGAAGFSQRLFDPGAGAAGNSASPRVPAKKAKAAARVSVAAKPAAASIDRSREADDLKAISGVGPKLEQVLNGLGIRSYGQIAAWAADEIAAVEETLGFNGRIVRDDWIGQATTLAQTRTKH